MTPDTRVPTRAVSFSRFWFEQSRVRQFWTDGETVVWGSGKEFAEGQDAPGSSAGRKAHLSSKNTDVIRCGDRADSGCSQTVIAGMVAQR